MSRPMSDPMRLATRGSALARWQADTTAATLRAADPDLTVEPLIVRSSGDADQTTALARFGRNAELEAFGYGGAADE